MGEFSNGVPLHRRHHLRGADCSDGLCTGAHVMKSARAPCAAWLRACGTPCPFGAQCWFPHTLPRSQCVPRPARGGVQVPASHADRAEAFLRAQLPLCVAVARARAHGAGKKADVLLLLCVEDAAAFDVRAALHALLAFPFFVPALVRLFVFDVGGGAHSWEELVARLRAALLRRAGAARLHCFPRAVERELAVALQRGGGDGDAAAPVALSKGAPVVVACVAALDGVYHVGLEEAHDTSVALLRAGSGGPRDAVCRAEHKLREAALRVPRCVAALAAARGGRGRGGLALDVGAAPGGWVRALSAAPLFLSGVVAVDPGALHWGALSSCEEWHGEWRDALPALADAPEGGGGARVVHMREQGAPALAQLLLAAGGARPFAAFSCDANVPAPAALALFASALPLLRSNALAVVTLKNFTGAKAPWEAACDDAEARFREACVHVERLHLFANALQEVTLIGTVR